MRDVPTLIQNAIIDVLTRIPKTEEPHGSSPVTRARAIAKAAAVKTATVSGTLSLPPGCGRLTRHPGLPSGVKNPFADGGGYRGAFGKVSFSDRNRWSTAFPPRRRPHRARHGDPRGERILSKKRASRDGRSPCASSDCLSRGASPAADCRAGCRCRRRRRRGYAYYDTFASPPRTSCFDPNSSSRESAANRGSSRIAFARPIERTRGPWRSVPPVAPIIIAMPITPRLLLRSGAILCTPRIDASARQTRHPAYQRSPSWTGSSEARPRHALLISENPTTAGRNGP